jgi:D-alanine--poly(phosphoribitol) ligase subunit 2
MNGQHDLKTRIRQKVIDLAARAGLDPTGFGDDELIPASGLLDSAALLELVAWYESEFNLTLAPEDINIDNLGSVNAMAAFLERRTSK